MTGLNREQKKAYARKLYMTEEGITQKEIATRVGATEATVSKWVNDGDWHKEKELKSMSKEQQVAWTHSQLAALRQEIDDRKEGGGTATLKELKEIIRLVGELDELEDNITLTQIVEIQKRFLVWLRTANPEKAMEFLSLSDAFIKDCM